MNTISKHLYEINEYCETIIYSIYHKSKTNLCYIGHTTDFERRYNQHRYKSCSNTREALKNPLYKAINKNGGFNDFIMEPLRVFSCNNKRDAQEEEQNFIDTIQPKMNTRPAITSTDVILCRCGVYIRNTKSDYVNHLNTKKHQRLVKELDNVLYKKWGSKKKQPFFAGRQ